MAIGIWLFSRLGLRINLWNLRALGQLLSRGVPDTLLLIMEDTVISLGSTYPNVSAVRYFMSKEHLKARTPVV